MDHPLELRKTLAQFATGVTVITCSDEERRPCGITANSFSSVSLDPPLILWNIGKASRSLPAFLQADHFAIHILHAHQEELARHFARSDALPFDGIDYSTTEQNVPVLPGVIARLDCRTHEIIEAGDHHIILGEVLQHEHGDGSPLLFFNSRYETIGR